MTLQKDNDARLHPKVSEAKDLMARGRMGRRDFLRVATLLGVSAGTAYAMAGLSLPAWADGHENMPFPKGSDGAKKGGVLKVAMQVQKMEDPATYSWTQMSNQSRHVVEYMAMTGTDNVTRPMLAEKWEASDDLKTWTFYIRKGVMWHNGEAFTAEHVAWNIQRWTDPALASSNVGLSVISGLVEDVDSGEKDDAGNPKMVKKLIDGAVEVVDSHTLRLHLTKPVLSAPEDLYNYPTAILHPSFKAPFSDNPIGTGPFRLAELKVGDRCILERVTKTTDGKDFAYWGGDVYLDAIHYFNYEAANQLTAFASGDLHTIYEFGIEQFELAKALPGEILQARTAQNLCCRMQVTQAPYDNKKLRQAIVTAIDNSVYTDLVFQGGGDRGENHHVAPVHQDYFALPPLKRDVAKAKSLLAEAGYPDGIKLTIDVGNTDGPWHQTVTEIMRDQLKDAGITLNINVMPASKYWEIWDKTPFGATAWTHRPLGTMAMSLGYRSGVPWNETKYASPEFDAALDAAEATLDVEERKKKMEKVEKIMQDDAIMVMPIWRPIFAIRAETVNDIAMHPTNYHQFNKVWLS
ncbi:MAG: ABC transporter substrate-binding protein [Magnetospiraceae bacterium]